MHRIFSFGETSQWKQIISETYPLEIKQVNIAGQDLYLYDNGKELSNSPYITDGGFFEFKEVLKASHFAEISKPVLIKTRGEIEVDRDLQSILIKDYFTYVLDISEGEESVWKNKVKSKTRNQVRKAEKLNINVTFGGVELLDDFYKVISKAWRDLGTPTHSKEFYKNIITHYNGLDHHYNSRLVVIYFDGVPVSVACLIFDNYSIHHPYAATLKEYNKFSVNNALYWYIIKFAIDKEIKIFDLGRSRIGQNTVPFKLSWGAEPQQLYYYYFNKKKHQNDEDGKIVQFLINCWKKLPIQLANFLGPKLIYKVLK